MWDTVEEIHLSTQQGVLSPTTGSGTIMVEGVELSCYGDFSPHFISHIAMTLARLSTDLLARLRSIHSVKDVAKALFGPPPLHPFIAYVNINDTALVQTLRW